MLGNSVSFIGNHVHVREKLDPTKHYVGIIIDFISLSVYVQNISPTPQVTIPNHTVLQFSCEILHEAHLNEPRVRVKNNGNSYSDTAFV